LERYCLCLSRFVISPGTAILLATPRSGWIWSPARQLAASGSCWWGATRAWLAIPAGCYTRSIRTMAHSQLSCVAATRWRSSRRLAEEIHWELKIEKAEFSIFNFQFQFYDTVFSHHESAIGPRAAGRAGGGGGHGGDRDVRWNRAE